MSSNSNNNGRAFEYSCINALKQEISKVRPVQIIDNSSLQAAKHSWNTLDSKAQETFMKGSIAATLALFDLEPRILENGEEIETLEIQKDGRGEEGDVRDIVINRRTKVGDWEIGLSLKHNNLAVKHSRLSSSIDFGKVWFGHPCSKEYWQSINTIFDFLRVEKEKETPFSAIPDKAETIYVPVLEAFINELKSLYNAHKDIPGKLVEYLLGRYDFYKVASQDRKRITLIQPYNLHGTLNKKSAAQDPKILVGVATLPTRIIAIGFKPESKNTIELFLDNGWQFSFRIHSARTICEPSLKFDIQIIGMPVEIITISSRWK